MNPLRHITYYKPLFKMASFHSKASTMAKPASETVRTLYSATNVGPWKYRLSKESGSDSDPANMYGTMFQMPAITVDNVILAKNSCDNFSALRVKRGPRTLPEVFAGMWAIPGGFLDYGKETLLDAAKRETCEETGIPGCEPVEAFTVSTPGRDPRQHTVSVVHITVLDSRYIDRINSFEPQDTTEVAEMKWIDINDTNHMFPFDHFDVLTRAVAMVNRRPEDYPVQPFDEDSNVPRKYRKT